MARTYANPHSVRNMSTKTAGKAKRKRKPRQAVIGEGWRTSDADEIERRRRRAAAEKPQVQAQDGRAYYGAYRVASASTAGSHRVEWRSAAHPINSCDCADHAVNGLGTCKHVEAVRLHLQGRRPPARRRVTEIYLDRSRQYEQEPVLRVLWASGLAANDPVRQAAGPFFAADDSLLGEPTDAIPALQRALHDAGLTARQLRLSAHIAPWLERLQQRRRQQADRSHFLADLAAGKRTLDIVHHRLYPYQHDGVLHLAFGGRAILADDMGLGKTVQAVAACELLRRLGRVQRVLVISPVSLKTEWQEQIARFTDLPAQLIRGSRAQRLQLYREPAFFNLANYEQVLYDGADMQRLLAPDVIILDEAQRIKNWQTRTADAVKRLASPYAFVLTGTPLENRIDEVYSIVQFVDPHVFGPLFRFNRDFHELDERGRPMGYKNLDQMHRRLRPILLRRRKSDVESELPERTVNTYFVPMHPEQRTRYDEYSAAVARLVHAARRRPLRPEEFQRLQQQLACMRMLCDTPYILDPDCRISPKLEELSRILNELLAEDGNKIIIFSEWTRMLDLVRELLQKSGTGHALHTGQVPQDKRRLEINRFKQEAACRVLLSSDAGATGLNLQAANIVINLDLPWNPARLEQRIARAWRKHQKRHVSVINLVCENSIEHRILHLLEQKRSLADGVLDGLGEARMALPSSRKMLIERLQALADTHFAEQPAAAEPESESEVESDAQTQAGPAPPTLQELPGELQARHPQALDTLALYAAGDDARPTLFAVVDGDVQARSDVLAAVAAHTAERPQLQVIDRQTLAAIERLARAGIVSINAPTQLLHGHWPQRAAAPAAKPDNGQALRLKAARQRLADAERKLGMARVLTDGGYAANATAPLTEALEEALGALADSMDTGLVVPIPLVRVHADLAPRAGLDDNAVALLAILRENPSEPPADAVAVVASAMDAIGTALERQALE